VSIRGRTQRERLIPTAKRRIDQIDRAGGGIRYREMRFVVIDAASGFLTTVALA